MKKSSGQMISMLLFLMQNTHYVAAASRKVRS
ncbi:hypothetical protein SRABI06_00312 [Pseudomonas brassicacearum]|nr:hypothetical protein SRABI06_00312 [Pseudomonas brassicacearum]